MSKKMTRRLIGAGAGAAAAGWWYGRKYGFSQVGPDLKALSWVAGGAAVGGLLVWKKWPM